MHEHCSKYGASLLRLTLGLLFVVAGIGKLLDPEGISGMLGSLGFPAPTFFAWLLLLSEIVFGLAVLVGWKLNYTVWPLVVIMVVALVLVHLKTLGDPMGRVNVLFHLVGLACLLSLYFTGPGEYAVSG